MMLKRRGSILATSIAMVAIFLTVIVASMAYVDASNKGAMSDRWRDTAEQAARSGMDFVMAWAQANIDQTSQLPVDWQNMDDGKTIDPVSRVTGVAAINTYPNINQPAGTIKPGDRLGAKLNEYVLANDGRYLVSFKARIQQFRTSENFPRQYRIGIVGRVRSPKPGSAAYFPNIIDSHERDTVVAERVLLTYVGKEVVSKFATLIDYDAVKNWVPGEDVWGPVHINRGYIDEPANPNFTTAAAIGPSNLEKQRSVMLINDDTAGKFTTMPGKPTQTVPIFHDTVSITAINQADITQKLSPAQYVTYDDPDYGNAVVFNSLTTKWSSVPSSTAQTVFAAPENSSRTEWGAITYGPQVLKGPIALPKSVRNSLPQTLGVSPGVPLTAFSKGSANNGTGWFNKLEDGVYLPTKTWWNGSTADVLSNSGYDGSPAAGGVYIRGNVEVMRMGVNGTYSYYLWQLGNCEPLGSPNRRCYAMLVDRSKTTPKAWLKVWPRGQDINTLIGSTGSTAMAATLFGAVPPAATETDPSKFQLNQTGTSIAQFTAPAGAYPFNGAIFVDLSLHDPARSLYPLMQVNGVVPLTGNIYALGDPGYFNGTTCVPTQKRIFSNTATSNQAERIATYQGTIPTAPASKLTVMATGNIFIQNDIYLDSLSTVASYPKNLRSVEDGITIGTSKDLFGLVADKQIVFGLYAPNAVTRGTPGCTVHGTLAALGDPAWDYIAMRFKDGTAGTTDEETNYIAYRGSVTTEGLMQVFPPGANPPYENYHVLPATPVLVAAPASPLIIPGNQVYSPVVENANGTTLNEWYSDPTVYADRGYPGTPLTVKLYPCSYTALDASNTTRLGSDPNITLSTRGNLVVYGGITQKKRGVLGIGNRSYDKDFRFDRRLLTLAPPIFPTSTNIVTRVMKPFTPINFPYRTSASLADEVNTTDPSLDFLGVISPGN